MKFLSRSFFLTNFAWEGNVDLSANRHMTSSFRWWEKKMFPMCTVWYEKTSSWSTASLVKGELCEWVFSSDEKTNMVWFRGWWSGKKLESWKPLSNYACRTGDMSQGCVLSLIVWGLPLLASLLLSLSLWLYSCLSSSAFWKLTSNRMAHKLLYKSFGMTKGLLNLLGHGNAYRIDIIDLLFF